MTIASTTGDIIAFLTAYIVILQHHQTTHTIAIIALIITLTVTELAMTHYPTQRNITANATLNIHTDITDIAIHLFTTRPIFGIGIDTF